MEEKNVEEIVRDLKVMLFDIVAKNEAKISVLEQAIVQEQDSAKEEELRTLWAKYNNFIKTAVNTTDVLTESLRGLSTCEEEYASSFQTSQEVVEEVEKDPITKVEARESEEKVETPVQEEVQEEKIEEAKEAPEQDPIITKEPVEEEKEVIKEEKVENAPLTPTVPEVVEEKKEEVVETPPSVEAPVEEVVEEQQVVAAVQLPTIEENETQVPEKLDTTEEVTNENQMVIMKNYEKDDRAILINQAQANKLRASKEMQTALYQSKSNTNVTEQQLEEMLGQVTTLYEEGKTKEAEELSNQINELSKTLQKAA